MRATALNYHLLAKPAGAACNLACKYCFFLSKENFYPDDSYLMTDVSLKTYIRQLLGSSPGPEFHIAWQGGEPMLRGLDFYRRSVQIAGEFRQPHQCSQARANAALPPFNPQVATLTLRDPRKK